VASTLSVKVQLENIEQANAGLAKLGQSATTAGNQLAQAGQKGTTFGRDITSSMQPLQSAFSGAQSGMQKFSQETLQTQQSAFRLTGALGEMGQSLPQVNSGLNQSGTAMEELVSNTGRLEQGMAGATGETSAFTGALGGIGDSMGQLAGDADNLGGALQGITADTGGLDSLASSSDQLTSSFDSLRPAAEGIVSPLTDMGSSMDTLSGAMAGAGTEAETFGGALTSMNDSAMATNGGLTETNTLLGDYSTAAGEAESSSKGFGGSATGVAAGMVGLASNVNSAWQAVDNLIDSQYSVQRANIAAARATEMARKAEEGLDKIIKGAKGNTDAIAVARQKLAKATGDLEKLQRAGVSSGAEYEAVSRRVADAQAELTTALTDGGVAADKAEGSVNKFVIGAQRATAAQENARIASENWGESIVAVALNLGGTLGGMVSTILHATGGFDKMGATLKSKLIPSFTGGATGAAGLGRALGTLGGIALVAYDAFNAFNSGLALFEGLAASAAGEGEKAGKKLKEAFDFTKLQAGFGPGGALMELIGKAGLDKMFDDVIKSEKKQEEQQKKLDESNKNLTKSTIEYGNAADTNMVATEGISSAIAALPGTIGPASSSTIQLRAGMDALKKSTQAAANKSALGLIPEIMGAMSTNTRIMSTEADAASMSMEGMRSSTVTLNEELQKNIDANYENARALLNLAGSATNTEAAISANHLAYAQSVDTLADLIAVENDAVASKEKMQTAINNELIGLKNEEASLRASIAASQDLAIQQQGVENALLKVTDAYETSNQALREARAVSDSATASAEKLHTALNNQLTALIEEEAKLNAAIAATDSYAIQKQALENATLAGVESAKTWIASLDEAAAKEEAEIATLQSYASQFGEFPSVIDPTVESLQGFIDANVQGGQAAIDFQQTVLDAYNGLVSEAQGLFDSLTKAIHESGEEQADGMKAAWDELLPGVEASLTSVEQAAITSFAHMQAEMERGVQAFQTKLQAGLIRGLNLDQATDLARGTFQSFLTEAQSESGAAWQGIWDEAQQIAASGSAEMINAAAKAIQEGKVPAEVEKMLQSIINKGEPAGQKFGASVGQGIISGIKASASAIAGAMSSATAGATLGEGVKKPTAATAAPKQQAPIKIDADITPAAQKLQQLAATIASIKQGAPIQIWADITPAAGQLQMLAATIATIRQGAPIPVLVDTQQAVTMITGLTTLITSIRQAAPVPVIVDTQQAVTMLTGLTTLINSIKQATPPPIAVNNAQAISQIQVVQTKLNAIKQGTPPTVAVNNAQAISQIAVVQTKLNGIKQTKIPTVSVNNSPAISAINQVQSKLNSLKDINRTITYRYRTVGSPPAGAHQHGGSFIVNKPTNIAGHKMGELNKPELVTVQPLSDPANSKDKTINIPTATGAGSNKYLSSNTGGSKGGDTIVIPVQIGNETIKQIVLNTAGKRRNQMFR
jgi:hypothetical protein